MIVSSKMVARLRVDPLGILGLGAILVAWWGASKLHLVSNLFLPPPGGVVRAIFENFLSSPYLANYNLGEGGLLSSLVYTVSNVAIALGISCVAGVALGLTTARNNFFRAVVDPVVLTVGTIPILVTAPFFLIWFGTSRAAQIALLVLYDVTVVYLFAQRAAANLDPTYVAASRTMGANSTKIITDVYLPGTLPEVFGGIRIAFAGSWGLEAFSELLGAPNGIGRVIQAMASGVDTQTMVAAILTLTVVAVGFDMVIAGAFGFITRWKRSVRF